MIRDFLGWFDTDESIKVVKETATVISEQAACVRDSHRDYQMKINEYKQKLETVEHRRQKETKLFLAVIDHIEDMIWAKDLEGRYLLANKAFRDKFCYGLKWSVINGLTDCEIADVLKGEHTGDTKFFYGSDTDTEVLKTGKAIQFLEHGHIQGKFVKLVVKKSPVCDFGGTMFATCGTSKDITELHSVLEKTIEAGNVCLGADGKELLLKELNKLEKE